MENPLTLLYFPTAVILGALHALEPGHAKTLTAAYLIGTKGTRRDALLLGISVTATHSIVVIVLAVVALFLGRKALPAQAGYWLQLSSGALVIALGIWMLARRWPQAGRRVDDRPATHKHSSAHMEPHGHAHSHDHGHTHDCDRAQSLSPGHVHSHAHVHGHVHDHAHTHDESDEDAHARAHAAALPEYVQRGERPSIWQVIAFGAAGGMIPCTAAVTVMLLAVTAGKPWLGLVTVLGFSLGLATTLVGIGMLVVSGLNQLESMPRLISVSRVAPWLSAVLVILTGMIGMLLAH